MSTFVFVRSTIESIRQFLPLCKNYKIRVGGWGITWKERTRVPVPSFAYKDQKGTIQVDTNLQGLRACHQRNTDTKE